MSQQSSPHQFPSSLYRITEQILNRKDTMDMYDGQEEDDNLVWDKNDETVEVAQQQMRLKTFCRKVEGFVQQKFGRPAILISPLMMGGFMSFTGCILPSQDKTYMTADEWYTTLAEMHIAQLIFQQNDLVTSTEDCRNRLWGDDFRTGNILLNESDDIAALIDWEYTYAGPTQFFLDPPWWLLLETAEMWSPDLEHWRQTYESRLRIWLSAIEKAEASMGASAYKNFAVPLSRYMRESWQTGRFFLSYAARKSWAFDAMYWNFLDERFFGDRDPGVVKGDLWKTRIDLLSDDERAAMEPFVQRKMAGGKERRIVEWDETEAQRRFSELLFN
ncbi:kinase-like domain protein [Fusarium subglutinans]|uniref:Kinase-like domain protein n=1 Tax=Gibberella subglutinans TaxID=42677 RepID=A0A8H5L2N6_GIBSU|nr:kinase-like domain protein [Fusarium subglutinans]KAF5583639.1 kinase-like domain protein [Fusarium subglutinans]